MLKYCILAVVLSLFALGQTSHAQDMDGIQKYLNDMAVSVKAADDPAEKRAILDRSFDAMARALDKVEQSPMISSDDRAGINLYRASLQENRDELAGVNGFDRVPDVRLDAFADYSVQSLEQAAEKTITISLVAALLIVIILILIV
ncbi:MAG: hypothetical protein SH809_13790 [Rhodothermales bacterium]|nr:hypothetical protein [Rhodothermales bacterium]